MKHSTSVQDLSWIQYGKEKFDWALVVNSWFCVHEKTNSQGRIKPRGEKELIIYSEQDFNLTKVGKCLIYGFERFLGFNSFLLLYLVRGSNEVGF